MKHAKLILFFALVLVMSITSTNSSDGVFTDNIESEGINLPTIDFEVSYEEHSPITIYDDSDFETQAASEEWDGEGTELSPYLIQGYNITDSFGGFSINDVSLYFEIRECPVNAECKVYDIIELPGTMLVIGEIVQAYTEEIYTTDRVIDYKKIRPFVFTAPEHYYREIGEKIGTAFVDGKSLSKRE